MDKDHFEEQRYAKAHRRVKRIKGFYMHLFWYLIVNIFLLVMIYKNLEADQHFFELSHFSTAIFWGIGLMFHWIGVFGRKLMFTKEWEDRKIKQYMNKDQNKFN